ncbi:hypothetical protein BD769DRAFT_1681616 [Suillus cothurnatus]|nr:hypothetical protein BD769DRAFT_1681616 [Suillus cothurnatus]
MIHRLSQACWPEEENGSIRPIVGEKDIPPYGAQHCQDALWERGVLQAGGYAQAMPAKYTILALLTFILIMSFICPTCNYTAKSACGLSTHQNQWCKGLRDASNNVINAHHDHQAPHPPPTPHTHSEAPLPDQASQPEFENPEPYELPQLPSRYQDELPALPIPVPIPPPVDDVTHTIPQSPVHSDSGTIESEGDVWVHTKPDTFGTFHTYQGIFSSYNPENTSSFDDVCDSCTFQQADGPNEWPWYAGFGTAIEAVNHTFFAPFLNATTFHLMNWFYESSSGNSLANVDHLVQGVIFVDDFECEDLRDFSTFQEAKRMDQADKDPDSKLFSTSDKWHEVSVKIKLPAEKHKYASETDAPECAMDRLYYWKPLEVIRSAYEEVTLKSFHNVPYKHFW